MDFDLEGRGHDAGAGDSRRPLHDRRSLREQGLMITLAIHAVYLASNGLLYMVIQINYQNQRNSPFETHMVMKSSLLALFVYFCAAALQTMLVQTSKELDDPRLLNHILGCSGILSPLSNALVFLPNMVGCIVVSLFVFTTTILLAYDVFKLISNCISKRNNNENNCGTSTSESVALEMSTGIIHNAATTSESTEMSTGISHNATTTSESTEMSNGINNI